MPAKTHTMHGRDHLPAGADPIPGLPTAVTFPDLVFELATGNDLLGYWRLGDAASPFADTSGHAAGPADAVATGAGTAMSEDIVGALVTGDDGAVQFNHLTSGEYLQTSDPSAPPFRFNFSSNSPFTVAAWIKPVAGSTTYPATAVGQYREASSLYGWRIGLDYPALTPFFQRRGDGIPDNVICTGPALTPDEWVFVVGTYDPTDGHKLYLDGALADSDPSTFAGTVADNFGVTFGAGTIPPSGLNYFLGGLDEVSVWGAALSPGDIGSLYLAGIGEAASPGSGVTSIAKSGATPLVGDVTLSEGANVTLTQAGQDIQIAAAGGTSDPAADPTVWMPLTTVTGGVPELVWDGNDELIPTLVDI